MCDFNQRPKIGIDFDLRDERASHRTSPQSRGHTGRISRDIGYWRRLRDLSPSRFGRRSVVHHRHVHRSGSFSSRNPQACGGGAESAGPQFERYRGDGGRAPILSGVALRPGMGERRVGGSIFRRHSGPRGRDRHGPSGRRSLAWGDARLRRHCGRGRSRGARRCAAPAPGPATRSMCRARSAARPSGSRRRLRQKSAKHGSGICAPNPSWRWAGFCGRHLRASSAIDLSDGLSLDLRRVCLASGVDAEIVAPPRFPGASLEQALHGGEDYELLFTVPGGVKVPGIALRALPLTRIGSDRAGGWQCENGRDAFLPRWATTTLRGTKHQLEPHWKRR